MCFPNCTKVHGALLLAREFQVVTLKFRMLEIESSRKDKRDQIFELTAEKKKITIKLDALRDFHAKRDIKVRQDLAKEQELRQVFKLKLWTRPLIGQHLLCLDLIGLNRPPVSINLITLLRNNIEGDIKTFADREKFLNDQIEGKFEKNYFSLNSWWIVSRDTNQYIDQQYIDIANIYIDFCQGAISIL